MSAESAGVDVVDSGSEVQVVEFTLGGESYAIDVSRVSSIVESQKITRLPRTPDSVKGIMDLRGETTAVVDPRELLEVSDGGGEEQILVLDRPDGKQKVGLLVDDVLDVEDVMPGMVDSVDELGDLDTRGTRGELAKGVIRKGEEDVDLVVWVDVDSVVEEGGT